MWVESKPHRNETAAKDISSSSFLQSKTLQLISAFNKHLSKSMVNSLSVRAGFNERYSHLINFIHVERKKFNSTRKFLLYG